MTHQLIALDRTLAAARIGFPLILGGHDHEPFVRAECFVLLAQLECFVLLADEGVTMASEANTRAK